MSGYGFSRNFSVTPSAKSTFKFKSFTIYCTELSGLFDTIAVFTPGNSLNSYNNSGIPSNAFTLLLVSYSTGL